MAYSHPSNGGLVLSDDLATITLTNVASATVTIDPDATVATVTTTTPTNALITVMAIAAAGGGGGGGVWGSPVEFSGLAAGQTVALGALSSSLTMLFVNGLLQAPSNYSISGSNLIIPPGFLDTGCDCIFIFQTLQ